MKVLVSLGGNAILQHGQKGTAEQQATNVQNTAKHLARLLRRGEKITITHGNGPQVGNILLQNEIAKDTLPPFLDSLLHTRRGALVEECPSRSHSGGECCPPVGHSHA